MFKFKTHKYFNSPYLAKPVSDSGFGTFVRYLEYKADWHGRQLIKVDRFYPSSKLCNVCGYKHNELKLSDRYWQCPICGTYHNRDINASIDLYKVGMEQPEFKPNKYATVLEHVLVDDRNSKRYLKSHHAMKQETTPFIRLGFTS